MQRRNTVNCIHRQAISIRLVSNRQLERGIDVALLFVSPHMQVGGSRTLVGQTMNEEGIRVEVEYDGAIGGEDGAVLAIRETVRMIFVGYELKEIDDIDKAHLEVGNVFAEEGDGSKGFGRGNVTAGRHYDVGVGALVVGGPIPYTETFGAVLNCFFHVQKLEMVLLICNDNVDVVRAAEAVVGNGEKAVSVGWKVDAYNFRALVGDDIEETGILVGKAVVILSPDCGGKKDIEG